MVEQPHRNQRIFSLFAILVVLSMICGGGAIIFEDWWSSRGDGTGETFDQGDLSTTEQELREAVSANPNDPVALVALAVFLGQTGQVDDAFKWYERAIALEPENWATRLSFADLLAQNGKNADAEIQYQKAQASAPENPQVAYNLGILYRNWNPPRIDEAIESYNKAIALEPESYIADQARQAVLDLGGGSPVASPAA